MDKPIGIVEIGSTNTKAYRYEDGLIVELGFKTIEFKKHYKSCNALCSDDIYSLIEFINTKFDHHTDIHVYATSLFRELSQYEMNRFKNKLKTIPSIIRINIVTSEMENEYTVVGAINRVPLNDNVCVFIGGGGSTEISICKENRILEMVNSNIGVTNITDVFPGLLDEYSSVSIDEVTQYISANLAFPTQKAKYIILAGGDFLLRYINAQYPVCKNTLFDSIDHPYLISYDENIAYENEYFHKIPLTKMKRTTPNNPNWWNGTRAMCAFVNALALAIGAEVIIPTKISMIYGIVAKLTEKKES